MSIISEQISRLKEKAVATAGVSRELLDAADTIEALSAKLAAASEKEIPQKPLDIEHDLGYFVCRNCGETIGYDGELEAHRYCLFCGQRIDWSEEERHGNI